MSGYLFVTAPEADHKAVNLLLHELSNWGYNDGESDFKLITAKKYDSIRSYVQEQTRHISPSSMGVLMLDANPPRKMYQRWTQNAGGNFRQI